MNLKFFPSSWNAVLNFFVEATSNVAILLGVAIVIPMTLFFAWRTPADAPNTILVTLFCLSFAWALVSLFRWRRQVRRMHLGSEEQMELFSGPKPQDPNDLLVWRLGWQFMLAIISALISMAAIALADIYLH